MTAPTRFSALAKGNFPTPSPTQQAFQQAIQDVANLRERLRELAADQAEARRTYWKQVGPLAATVVAARRALFGPLEEALLLSYFSRAEEKQIREVLLANAQSLHDRFGEDTADLRRKYAPRRPAADSLEADEDEDPAAPAPAEDDARPHEAAAHQARAQRKTKAERAQEAAARQAREEELRLLSNTKTVYRQLARANHPDLERDPAVAAEKTTRMQHITEAYEANDLYTLLQLLAEHAPATPDRETDDVLTRYTNALLQQQTELKQQLNELKYGVNGFAGTTGKKREAELRQLKRHLRAEADYVLHVGQLIREPAGLRELLKELTAAGQEGI